MVHDRLNLPGPFRTAEVVEVVDREGIAGQWVVGQILDRFAGKAASVDEDPTLTASKHDAGAAVIGNAHRDITGVAVLDRVLQRHIEAVRRGWIPGRSLDPDRLAADRPLGNVEADALLSRPQREGFEVRA
ncbi:MAG: hypothetical protein EBZ13_15155 [Planctomycetia bacterium]|nr:hypothetical protein [Planctomycetia bacterium]